MLPLNTVGSPSPIVLSIHFLCLLIHTLDRRDLLQPDTAVNGQEVRCTLDRVQA